MDAVGVCVNGEEHHTMKKYKFGWCAACDKKIYNPLLANECVRCGTPYYDKDRIEVEKSSWIAVRMEDSICILIGVFDSKEKADFGALLDNAARDRNEPFCANLSTMIPLQATKSEMLKWFYGVEINSLFKGALVAHGEFEESGISWIVGKAKDVLS